jgi:hypothetical protein
MVKTYLMVLTLAVMVLLAGCVSTLNERETARLLLEPTEQVIGNDMTPDELLEMEKQHMKTIRPGMMDLAVKDFSMEAQVLMGYGYRPYVLDFAQKQRERSIDGLEVMESTLDLANLGMHIAGGATLGPLWMSMLDVDRHAIRYSKEKRYLEMPGIFIVMAADELEGRPATFEAVTEVLGEKLVKGDTCRYHVYPYKGAFGYYHAGTIHTRRLLCGEPSVTAPSAAKFGNATILTARTTPKNPLSRLYGEDRLVSLFFWLPEYSNRHEIDSNIYNGTYRTPAYTSGVEGYKALKPYLPEAAYTVFTGPNDEGQWKIWVAHGDTVVTYDPPWEK